MKTSEFIERVEKLDYKTVKVHSFIAIYDPDNMDEKVAAVNMRSERQLSISGAIYGLAKLIVEYAETPLDEREDEKRYYIKVFDIDAGYLNIKPSNKPITSFNFTGNWYRTEFTKSEIEQLKQRDDIPIDWDKVKLEEVEE